MQNIIKTIINAINIISKEIKPEFVLIFSVELKASFKHCVTFILELLLSLFILFNKSSLLISFSEYFISLFILQSQCF